MDKNLNPAINQVTDKAVIVAEQKKQKEHQGFMVLIPGLTVWKYDLRDALCEENIHKVEIKKEKAAVNLTIVSEQAAELASVRFSLEFEDGVLYDQALNKKNALKHFNRQIDAMERYRAKYGNE